VGIKGKIVPFVEWRVLGNIHSWRDFRFERRLLKRAQFPTEDARFVDRTVPDANRFFGSVGKKRRKGMRWPDGRGKSSRGSWLQQVTTQEGHRVEGKNNSGLSSNKPEGRLIHRERSPLQEKSCGVFVYWRGISRERLLTGRGGLWGKVICEGATVIKKFLDRPLRAVGETYS